MIFLCRDCSYQTSSIELYDTHKLNHTDARTNIEKSVDDSWERNR